MYIILYKVVFITTCIIFFYHLLLYAQYVIFLLQNLTL